MTRYKEEGRQVDWSTAVEQYAIQYPVLTPGDSSAAQPEIINRVTGKQEHLEQDLDFPPRIRWAHAHPTWTYHALPFIADALLAKLGPTQWQQSRRVQAAIGHTIPKPNPRQFMHQDEDML